MRRWRDGGRRSVSLAWPAAWSRGVRRLRRPFRAEPGGFRNARLRCKKPSRCERRRSRARSEARERRYAVLAASFPAEVTRAEAGTPIDAVVGQLQKLGYDVHSTSVDLGDNGEWRRVLVGDFATRPMREHRPIACGRRRLSRRSGGSLLTMSIILDALRRGRRAPTPRAESQRGTDGCGSADARLRTFQPDHSAQSVQAHSLVLHLAVAVLWDCALGTRSSGSRRRHSGVASRGRYDVAAGAGKLRTARATPLRHRAAGPSAPMHPVAPPQALPGATPPVANQPPDRSAPSHPMCLHAIAPARAPDPVVVQPSRRVGTPLRRRPHRRSPSRTAMSTAAAQCRDRHGGPRLISAAP